MWTNAFADPINITPVTKPRLRRPRDLPVSAVFIISVYVFKTEVLKSSRGRERRLQMKQNRLVSAGYCSWNNYRSSNSLHRRAHLVAVPFEFMSTTSLQINLTRASYDFGSWVSVIYAIYKSPLPCSLVVGRPLLI